MKLCPTHKTRLTRRVNKDKDLQTFARALNKFYACGLCASHVWHIYCYLCDTVIIMIADRKYPNIINHIYNFHGRSYDLFMFVADKLISCKTNGNAILLKVVINNPQFALIFPDTTDMPLNVEDFYKDESDYDRNRKLYPMPESKHKRIELFETCLKSSSRNYRCRFCDEEYECLPSLKVARKHVRECEAHRKLDTTGL